MSRTPNPYQPPTSVDEPDSWWKRFGGRFRSPPQQREPNFSAGDAIIFEGIAFFIDPNDTAIAYAASPAADHGDRSMNLIIAETIRILPSFLAEHSDLQSHLVGRKLCVRMIDSYTDDRSEFHREHLLEWDLLEALLEDSTDEPPTQDVRG